MRTLVCGGRDYGRVPGQREALFEFLDALTPAPTVIIHGGARGADALAGEWARINAIQVEVYLANWAKYGRAAGPIRNGEMLRDSKPERIVAFAGGSGTADMVKRATAAGVPVLTP